MDSRLIFLHLSVRLKQRDGSPGQDGSHGQMCACRKAEGIWIPKPVMEIP